MNKEAAAKELEKVLKDVEDTINQLTSLEVVGSDDAVMFDVCKSLSPIESAKLNVSLAYAVASLFYTATNATTKPTKKDHTIQADLSRIKQFVGKVNQLEAKAKEDKSASSEQQPIAAPVEKKRKIVINKAASKRIVKHQLS